MASTDENRAAFISSLLSFMGQYGFDGVDLDWEVCQKINAKINDVDTWQYPGATDRGGKNADTENYVTLVQELRAAFGTTYGPLQDDYLDFIAPLLKSL